MKSRSALIVRENQAFEITTYPEQDLHGWVLDIHYRPVAKTRRAHGYVTEIVRETFRSKNAMDVLVIYQEELHSDLLRELFDAFRKQCPGLPIVLIRRENGRGGNPSWAQQKQPSLVIDFTEKTGVLIAACNRLTRPTTVLEQRLAQ